MDASSLCEFDIAFMASSAGGSAGASGGPGSSIGPSGRTRRRTKRPRDSNSSAATEDQGTKLQEDFTW